MSKLTYAGAYTVANMQPEQLKGMALRNVRSLALPRLPVDFDDRYERQVPADPPIDLDALAANTAALRGSLDADSRETFRRQAADAAAGTPTFLNQSLTVASEDGVEWYDDQFEDHPLLWALKLYAFEPLWWLCLGFDPDGPAAGEHQSTFDGWVTDWMSTVRIGEPGYLRGTWTPWAVSLRILYWSRYLAWRDAARSPGADFDRLAARELYKNALFLCNHVELDVGGNHLIENGAALVVAGVLFDEREWVETGTDILTETARTQFLTDGGHFERSPMYHVVTTTRYLTVCDLLERDGRHVPALLRQTAAKATGFLRYLRPPDGQIPLLNDSAHGQSLSLTTCLDYATAIGFDEDSAPAWGDAEQGVPESGYQWLRNDVGSMLIDGGPVGPPHLPGHSHSDTLQVLLWLDNCPIVTDTGIFDYAGNERRSRARSVAAHNTVQVGDTEPIALAGKYLMGPRPDPTTRYVPGPVSLFEGRYEANPYGEAPYTHHRAVFAAEDWWLIWDTVSGHQGRPVQSRLHLHPDVTASQSSDGRVDMSFETGTATTVPLNGATLNIASSEYYPEFGVAHTRPVLECHDSESGAESTSLGLLVTRDDPDEVTVERGGVGAVPTQIVIDGVSYELPNVRHSPE